MFLTTWHMFLATILTQLMSRFTNMLPGVKEKKVDSVVWRNQIFPVSVFFAVSLVLSNKAYIYLAVSYIQMLKAFTPVAVLIFSFLLRLEKSSFIEFNIVAIISVGVAMTSLGELNFSYLGFTFQFLAIIAESSRLVLTNILMKSLKMDPLSTLYYIAPFCCIFIGIACFIFEFPTFPFERLLSFDFFCILLINGIVAFTLNVAVVMLIGSTSALVLTLAGIVKDLLLVFLSTTLFKSPITQLQYMGYLVALLGLNLHKEYKKNPENFRSSPPNHESTEGTGSKA